MMKDGITPIPNTLVLYKYKDNDRKELDHFAWQLCDSNTSINDLKKWLKRDSFPSLVESGEIIKKLGNGERDDDPTPPLLSHVTRETHIEQYVSLRRAT